MSLAAVALAGSAAALGADAGEPRRRRVLELVRRGRTQEAAALCLAVLDEEPDGQQWLGDEVVAAMEQAALGFAGDLATILTGLERGSAWHPAWLGGRTRPIANARLSVGKLRHDIDQFEYLRRRGIDAPLDSIIADYKAALARLSGLGIARAPLTDEDERTVGRAFGRLVHVADAPRVARALSPSWHPGQVQRRYLEHRPNVVVIDDFLTDEALWGLLRFCQDSTIWAGNRYAHGRLSTLFFTGFNAPLVLQIAEEIRDAFPLLIGERHPLRQLWAFKNTEVLPGDSTVHADFAAINVNFWITPEAANLDPDSGGMVVYDLEAPLSWGFRQYNERPDLIRELMALHRPRAIRIPYRQNRAILFNSDLFHGTEAVCFRPDYLSHRINVTMLYGDRRLDEHHAEPESARDAPADLGAAWRSAALAHRRR
ncbi:hypothetical protein ACPPTR_12735 [Ralstonia pseudosolanacearum]|uniref:hypothetical protein n=1 Tax=Ralstonia pseudosolanacearum TaxID=1310165 RepID=UPI000B92F07C|nr:hypothetical protein [Ralstonia pseudosolanacearum]MCD9228648.1 hypothetical protein [Ralstonia pseudosolanacearum]